MSESPSRKRSRSPSRALVENLNKGRIEVLRDDDGFRIRGSRALDAEKAFATEAVESEGSTGGTGGSLEGLKVIDIRGDMTVGAKYIIEGSLRKVVPYYYTYLTFCKMRWRDRKLIDIFTTEFRDRDEAYYVSMNQPLFKRCRCTSLQYVSSTKQI